MMKSKWVIRIVIGLLLAVILLNLLPLVSGYAPPAAAPMVMAPPPEAAPMVMAPSPEAVPMVMAGTPASIADIALAAPPVSSVDVAPSPASVAEVALANPPVAAPPVYTTASPMPRIQTSIDLVQTQPSLDPTLNAMMAQSSDPMIKASMMAQQTVKLPPPPARIQAPQMTQGLSDTIVGMDI